MLARKIAYNTIISALSRIFGTLVALVTIGLTARYLGQNGFGYYSTVLAFLYVFSVLADLGLYSIALRDISRDGASEKEVIGRTFSLRFYAGFFIFLAGSAIAWLFPYPFEIKLGIALAAAGFWFLSNTQVLMPVFQKHLVMGRASLAEIAGRIIQLGAVWLIISKNLGFLSVVLALSLSGLVNFLMVVFFARRYVPFSLKWDISRWQEVLKESFPLALSAVFSMVYFKLDTVMLSLLKPASDVGIYGAAYKILENLIFFPALFVGLLMPLLSKYASVNPLEFKSVSQKGLDLLLIFAAPLAVGGLFLSGQLISLIAGGDFVAATGILKVLLFATAIIFLGALFSNMIIALGRQKALAKIYALGALFNFAVNLALIPKFSYWGASASTLATEILVTALMLVVIKKATGYLPGFSILAKISLACLAMAAFLFLAAELNFAISLFLSAAVYFAAILAVKAVKPAEALALLKKQT